MQSSPMLSETDEAKNKATASSPVSSEIIHVKLLMTGGHECEISLPSDAPLLRELFQALANRNGEEIASKSFQIPIDSGSSCLYIPGESFMAIATDPPVQVQDMGLSIKPRQKKEQQIKKLELQLDIYRKLEELSPTYGKIERKSRLSRSEFLENYYAKNTPVILTDIMANWQALSLWTPEYLKQKYGHVCVGVQANRESNPDYEIEREKHQKMMLLRDYIDMVVSGGDTNDYYMGSYNGTFYKEEMQGLFEDMEMFPEYLEQSKDPNKIVFWFGPASTVTKLHYDLLNSLLCQVYGRKRVRLISPNQKHLLYNDITFFSSVDLENPDYDKYPRFRDVNIIDTVVEPGEVLFIPVGWWHHVKALDISISVSFMNFVFPNKYD